MHPEWTPMRWPSGWRDPSALALLEGTSINCLLVEKSPLLESVIAHAQKNGIRVGEVTSLPAGVTMVAGEWPGIQLSRSGEVDMVSAGPTSAPWVDSNGWLVRLAATLHPESAVWVDAAPKEPRLFPHSYVTALADAAAHGGRWVIALDNRLAAGIAGQEPDALETWKRVSRAAGFFAARKAWADYLPEAIIGVVSDFSGPNESLSHELLNLLDRANVPYRIIPKTKVSAPSFSGLRAVIYADGDPPVPDLRKQILVFVERGGMLIAGPKWGPVSGAPARYGDHPHYALRALGKGRVAIARSDIDDAYVLANDSVLLVSHRYELLRFYNGGALGSFLTIAPDRMRALVQMVFFSERGPNIQKGGLGDAITVRVAGRYRSARLWTLDQALPRKVEMRSEKDAADLYLPPVSQYAAVELELRFGD